MYSGGFDSGALRPGGHRRKFQEKTMVCNKPDPGSRQIADMGKRSDAELIGDPIAEGDLTRPFVCEARTRRWLTKAIVLGCAVSLLTGGIISLITGEATPVAVVWAVVGPILGRVSGYYFGSGP